MKITAIKQQVKDSGRVSIFVDGKYSFSLSLDELVAQKLRKDDEVDGVRLARLKKLSEDGKLRLKALAWVMNRPHSVKEFKDYMYKKKADPGLTERLIEEFRQKKYLNDVAFGVWLVELRQRTGRSNRAITSELFKKGLPREDVLRVLEGQEENELERLKLLISKKSQLSRYRDNPQKLAQYLAAQGFSYGDVKQALALDGNDA